MEHKETVELTKEEALVILKALSSINGFLLGVDGSGCAAELLEYPSLILVEKLK